MRFLLEWVQVFRQRKMAALAVIGFAGGLPLFLTSRTLQAWMTVEGVDLKTIGLFSLVGLPYSIKVLWSPLMDRFVPPFLGRRRGWLLVTQVLLILALLGLSFCDPKQAALLAVAALLVAFMSASQDIVIDAYRSDILEHKEMGAGAAVYVTGYRLGMLAAGSLALVLADHMSWPWVYRGLALLLALASLGSVRAPEPEAGARLPEDLSEAIGQPFVEFFTRSGWRAVLILAFVPLYKYGDSLLGNMATPFLLKAGYSQSAVGAIQGGIGLLATIVGALAGGAALEKIGINRSLWVFGFAQALSNACYLLLALSPGSQGLLVGTIVIENLCAGLGTAAFVAFFMSLCSRSYSATQYALLTSLMAFSRDILVAPAGAWAERLGWPAFFALTIAASAPGLLLLPFFAPWSGEAPVGAAPRGAGTKS